MTSADSIAHPEGEDSDALWAIDAVPDAEVGPVLGHHHVTAGYPLDVAAEGQQRGLHGALRVVQVELEKGGEERSVGRVDRRASPFITIVIIIMSH